jgi:hypothetical protein
MKTKKQETGKGLIAMDGVRKFSLLVFSGMDARRTLLGTGFRKNESSPFFFLRNADEN